MDTFGAVLHVPLSINRFVYADDDSINLTDPSGLIAGLDPYKVEEAIEEEYASDHEGQDVLYGGWTRLGDISLPAYKARPDIFNNTLNLYNEIKPLSLGGYYSGVAQMKMRAKQFGPGSGMVPTYSPDLTWPYTSTQPSIFRFINVKNNNIFFDAGGILFYINVTESRVAPITRYVPLCVPRGLSAISIIRFPDSDIEGLYT